MYAGLYETGQEIYRFWRFEFFLAKGPKCCVFGKMRTGSGDPEVPELPEAIFAQKLKNKGLVTQLNCNGSWITNPIPNDSMAYLQIKRI